RSRSDKVTRARIIHARPAETKYGPGNEGHPVRRDSSKLSRAAQRHAAGIDQESSERKGRLYFRRHAPPAVAPPRPRRGALACVRFSPRGSAADPRRLLRGASVYAEELLQGW